MTLPQGTSTLLLAYAATAWLAGCRASPAVKATPDCVGPVVTSEAATPTQARTDPAPAREVQSSNPTLPPPPPKPTVEVACLNSWSPECQGAFLPEPRVPRHSARCRR